MLDDVEALMTIFDLKSWFNTALDGCNYVLTKYNSRFSLDIDEENAPFSGKTIHWCSNANTEWTTFLLKDAKDEDLLLDERFGIPMYYIIEFLARRRNRKSPGELHYMNMYPGLDSELGVLSTVHVDEKETPQEQFRKEDEIFRSLHVDNRPDMDINAIVGDVAAKLKI